jgi:prepilin-type processing-associated H-X9-DG protein/prepilin-type N-terminal cleavage/methylation domain-containing protein
MRRTAFSLVELLVVIAIAALLAGILMPVLRRSRRQANAVRCGSNIKQLALAMLMYETDNKTFPYSLDSVTTKVPPGGYAGNRSCDRPGFWWFDHIVSYTGGTREDDLFWCPCRVDTGSLKPNILWRNYGANLSVCKYSSAPRSRAEFRGRPVRVVDVKRPAGTVLVLDSGYGVISWWHATVEPPVELAQTREDTSYVPGLSINLHRLLWPGSEPDAFDGRHPNRTINAAFVDGHVARMPSEDLLVERTDDGYRNPALHWVPE